MSSGIRIREMTEDDLGAVGAIASELADAPHWPRSAYEVVLDPAAQPERIALVAVDDDGRICGLAIIALVSETEAELESIAVEEARQRRGIARALFAEVTRRLRGRGTEDIFLEVRESNKAAQAFYRAEGFSIEGRRPAYYADPREDALIMGVDLRKGERA